MPMYFTDLESVQGCVNDMRKHKEDKRYNGIYPEDESQLPQARQELAQYFRDIWNDELQAMEIELAVSEENYEEKMSDATLLMLIKFIAN